jgi:hypothetical protein
MVTIVQDKGSNYQLPVIPPSPMEEDLSGIDFLSEDEEELEHPDW